MPKDDYGIVCDLILDPPAVFNRMNPSQLYEVFLTRKDIFVSRRLKQLLEGVMPVGIDTTTGDFMGLTADADGAWRYFIQYMHDVNPNQAKVIEGVCNTAEKRLKHLTAVTDTTEGNHINQGIYHSIPPYLKHICSQWVLDMEAKYPSPETPVEFVIEDTYGNKKRIRTVDNVCIGSKYVYCLYKIPHLKSSGVAYINQHRTPVTPSSGQRILYPIGQTALRMGEDEVRNLSMVAGSWSVARIMGISANSTEGVNLCIDKLLNEKYPTQLPRLPLETKYITSTNNMSAMTKHLLATVGVDISKKLDNAEIAAFNDLVLPVSE